MRGSIVKRASGYSIVYEVGQRWDEKSGCWKRRRKCEKVPHPDTRKHAEKLLAERLSQVHRGEYIELKKITFNSFADRWLSQYAEGAVKPSTLASYQSVIRNHLKPYFGAHELVQITLEDVQAFVTRMRESGLSPKTIVNQVVILKEIFKHAVRWGYLRSSPAEHVERPRVPHREMDFLTPEEIRLFLDTAQQVCPERYPLFLTAVMTGMRRGELLAMRWENLDWQRRQYFVKESYYRAHFQEPKSEKSRRAINLAPIVCEVLEGVYQAQQASGSNEDANCQGLIFCHMDGHPLDPDHLGKKEFHRVLKAAGMRRIRFHDLRHTYVALLIAQGESSKYIQHQLGHASVQITLDRYGHLMPEINEEAAARLEAQVFGLRVHGSKLAAKMT